LIRDFSALSVSSRSQRPAAHLLADDNDILWRQCRSVEEPDAPLVEGLEQAVENAAMIMGVAVERGAEAVCMHSIAVDPRFDPGLHVSPVRGSSLHSLG